MFVKGGELSARRQRFKTRFDLRHVTPTVGRVFDVGLFPPAMMYDPCAIEMAEELGMDPEDFSDPFAAEDSAIAFNPRNQYHIANIRPEHGSPDAIGGYMRTFFASSDTNLMQIDQKRHPHLPQSAERGKGRHRSSSSLNL